MISQLLADGWLNCNGVTMALKVKIDKDTYDALTDELKKEYKKKGSDYVLDVNEDEIAPELRRALERTKLEKDDEKKKREELEEEIETLKAVPGGKKSIDQIETAHKQKIDKITEGFEKKVSGLQSFLKKLLVSDVAKTLAAKISRKPVVLLPHIEARLVADLEGETPTTVILGKDGKPNAALKIEDLEKEFVDSEDFADIIIGSKASGSGGGGSGGSSGGAKKPEEYTEAERVTLYRTNRAEFDRLFPPR